MCGVKLEVFHDPGFTDYYQVNGQLTWVVFLHVPLALIFTEQAIPALAGDTPSAEEVR